MTLFRLRNDLQRVRLGSFALPLGIDPVDARPPVEGYTVTYNAGEEGDPDTYAFHVVVSHERLGQLIGRAFALLPARVSPIVEIDSYDAYRAVDVHIGREGAPTSREEFLDTWREFEPVFLEEGAIGIGANSDEPFIEVFIDQWKGVSLHVPLDIRDDIEAMLSELGLGEVPATWPEDGGGRSYDATIRPVLDTSREELGSLDELLFELRRRWHLELNIDPDTNIDDAGRDVGQTLWHVALYLVRKDASDADDEAALLTVWLTAPSWTELESLVGGVLEDYPEWEFYEWYSAARVAFDDRPEELEHLTPRRAQAEVHLVELHRDAFRERAGDADEAV